MYIINYNLLNFDYNNIYEYVYRINRITYIDNIDIIISFYNNKNENIVETLIKLLMKIYQIVLNFLKSYKSKNEKKLKFDNNIDNKGY